ncbi:MAG: zinc dependent phospholipase C family protein [Cellulosilyticaceae bacterium]
MPDTISHYLFGLDTTKNIPESPLYRIIKEHRNLFFIGCQGPDPMYYHRPYKKENYSYVAARMHSEQTGYFLSSSLCYLKKFKDTPQFFEPCLAYICGMLCHYALDTTTHPYIFYLGGRFIPDDPSTHKYKGLHKQIEMALDALLLQEIFGLKANQFKVHKHIVKDIPIPDVILSLYEELLFSIYAISDGSMIFKQSYQDFRSYYKVTYDHFGVKKNFASTISPLLPQKVADISSVFSYHHCVDEFTDYLNAEKNVWLHPVTGNVYTHSFKDLIRNAHKISSKLLLGAWDFLESEITLEELEALLPNISYLTGLPLADTRPMHYYKF